jgi:hypothetical protein
VWLADDEHDLDAVRADASRAYACATDGDGGGGAAGLVACALVVAGVVAPLNA